MSCIIYLIDQTIIKCIYLKVIIDIPNAEWIKLNYRQVGYYMVNYSENDWSLLSNLLENNIDVSIALKIV